MKKLARTVLACALLCLAAPVAQAGIISIDDGPGGMTLSVASPFSITSPGAAPPGSGTVINGSNFASNNFSAFNLSGETLSFTFTNQLNWNSDVYFYRYFTDAGGNSDLFVIQGFANTTPDHVTFISGDSLNGNPLALVPNNTTATPINLGSLAENNDWQLAFDTGVDQYYIRSTVPEPTSLALFGMLTAAGYFGWRRRKQLA
ncbi:MAG: PEP-CTERM sorting domain-containing protein [Gemmataceae bacterium]